MYECDSMVYLVLSSTVFSACSLKPRPASALKTSAKPSTPREASSPGEPAEGTAVDDINPALPVIRNRP